MGRAHRALVLLEALQASCRRLERNLLAILKPKRLRRPWTREESTEVRRRYPHMRTDELAAQLGRSTQAVYVHAQALGLKKSAAYLASEAPHRNKTRNAGCFRKGLTPWNKGRKGYCVPGSEKGWFKKGRKPLNTWKPIGTETVTKDGYLVRKVSDKGGYNNDDWKFVHHLVWEKKHGPVPPGHVLGFRNGNKRDFRLSNLVLRSFAENMRLNTIHRYPVELKQTIRALGKLKRTIRRKEDEKD